MESGGLGVLEGFGEVKFCCSKIAGCGFATSVGDVSGEEVVFVGILSITTVRVTMTTSRSNAIMMSNFSSLCMCII